MNINDFLGIAIIGVALSLIVQAIKNVFGTSSLKTKGLTILLSIIVGAGYYFVRQTAWYEPILGILSAASTTWALLFNNGSTVTAASANTIHD